MNQNSLQLLFPRLFIIALIGLVNFWLVVLAYRRYTGLSALQSLKLWALAIFLTVVCVASNSSGQGGMRPHMQAELGGMEPFWQMAVPTELFFFLVIPFAVRLYRKWIGGHLTEAEKLPGMDGVRAWLGVGNVFCAILIPICAWQVFATPLPILFVLTFGLLLLYPLFNPASASLSSTAAPMEDLSSEREKVLQLLEAGKITAEESAELLNALGHSIPPRPKLPAEQPLSPQRKLVLLGAFLLLVGFFLPWFSINLGAVANEMAAQLQQNMNQMTPAVTLPQIPVTGGTMRVHAADLAHGLGWWILILGVGAAVLPFFTTNLKAEMQKKVILVALATGAFLLFYVLSDSLRFVSAGIALALAGYLLEFAGTVKELWQPGAKIKSHSASFPAGN